MQILSFEIRFSISRLSEVHGLANASTDGEHVHHRVVLTGVTIVKSGTIAQRKHKESHGHPWRTELLPQ